MSRQSFNSVRSYFFRAQCATIEREQREYGGRSLEAYGLDDFRRLYAASTSQAVDHCQAITNRYNPYTRSWDRPFRRIVR